MEIPKQFNEYVNLAKEEIPYKNIMKHSFILSKEEAIEDFQCFKYILDNAYSGKDFWENNGISFSECYKKIQSYIENCNEIKNYSLGEVYYNSFKGIHDGHLAFIYSNISWSRFESNYQAYFSDLLIEKINEKYLVAQSNVDNIKIGMQVSCSNNYLFPTLSPINKEYFLYGIRSWTNVEYIDIMVDNLVNKIPVHKCKAGEYNVDVSQPFTSEEYKDIAVMETPTFSFDNSHDISFEQQLYEKGKLLSLKKTVIWNLLSNGGGSSNYPKKFIEGLNDYANWKVDVGVLHSHITDMPKLDDKIPCYKEWEFYCGNEYDLNKSKYFGNLILLVNNKVASSGEAAVAYAKSVRNHVLVGENTAGCGTFGDTLFYKLPNSHMIMKVPYKIFLGMGREGEGFEPDFWVDSSNVKTEVMKWLNSPDKYFPNFS